MLSILRLVVGSEEAAILATGNGTHDAGLRLTAKLVHHGVAAEMIANVIEGLLPPNYQGNSMKELPEWIASARKKGFDQPATERPKKTAADRLCEYFDQSGATLFHDEAKRGFISAPVGVDGIRHFAAQSSEGRSWLIKLGFDRERKAFGVRAIDETINLLDARARFDAPMHRTHLRVGGDNGRVIIDLGRDDGRCVIIKEGGWNIGVEREVKLVRSAGFGRLPEPARNGNLDALKHLLGLNDENWVLLLAFLLNCLRPVGPYMLLLVEGEQGSGKSVLCSIVKRIVDPNKVEKARLPETERDLMIHAQDYFLLSFDNVSGMKGDLSDALCVLATGGGFATRKLYSDNELFVFDYARPVMINGISDFASRPDLLERAIPLRLPAIGEGQRKTEGEILAEFTRRLPDILGGLYDIVAAALEMLPTIDAPNKLRMADVGRWLMACEPHAGLAPNSFVNALLQAQDEVFIDRVQNDAVYGKLIKELENGPFEGSAQELLDRITLDGIAQYGRFPNTPALLSRHLDRLKPAMAKAGVRFERLDRTHDGRRIRIWRDGQEDQPAYSPIPY